MCYAVDEMTGQRGVQNSHHMRFAPGYQPLLVPQRMRVAKTNWGCLSVAEDGDVRELFRETSLI